MVRFKINEDFVEEYRSKPSPFKTALGEVVFYRTYSRIKEDGNKESWVDCLERVVNGVYTYQKRHCNTLRLHWDNAKAQRSAQTMFDLMFHMKILPPGRGLFKCGDPYIEDTNDSMSLYNCSFVSTQDIKDEGTLPFTFGMNSLFNGVGLGFDTRGAEKLKIKEPGDKFEFIIDDTRESWVDSMEVLLDSYFFGKKKPIFDYNKIRPSGAPLLRFGGFASGPDPLKELHRDVTELLEKRIGKYLTSVNITDIFNMCGRCIIAGASRRSAEIALGDENDEDFLEMKDYNKFPEQCMKYRWMSNNSIFATVGKTDYNKILGKSGEVPGLMWLENARKYGRTEDPGDYVDHRVLGQNPCAEISLESFEMCNLVEIFPSKHDSFEDFKKSLKFSYLYSKTITLLPTSSLRTNEVQMRNRRLGISVSGVMDAFKKNGMRETISWLDDGYKYLRKLDKIYSGWFKVGQSIKLTTVKPSGTVSILSGVSSGMHAQHAEYYIRRVRIGFNDPVLEVIKEAGYLIEDDVYGGEDSIGLQKVVSFPTKEGFFDQKKDDLTIWQQVKLVALLQRYWADNSVSVTCTYKKDEEKEIPRVLEYFERELKSISFLPLTDHFFALAPLETISKEKYEEMNKDLKPINFSKLSNANDAVGSKFCDTEQCEI